MTSLETFAAFACELADLARPIASQYFGKPVPVDVKADDSPVTQADREIETAIREAILRQFPTHGFYGEETERFQTDAAYVWVIDPIDGTRAFIGQKSTFTTLIGLCHHGKPVVGVIDQPIRKERWIGSTRTMFNQQDVHHMVKESLEEATIATTSMSYFGAMQAKGFAALEKAAQQTVLNHDGYAFGLLANGAVDVAVEVKLKPYDFCALVPVVEGAGGIITDWSGTPITLASAGDVVASTNKTLHTQALDLLNNPR